MNKEDLEQRLISIESAIACLEKTFDELNQVVIEQAKLIDLLLKQNQFILNNLEQDVVKPLSEETPPPHY